MSEQEPTKRSRAGAVIVVAGVFTLLGFLVGALASCGTEQAVTADTTPTTVTMSMPSLPPISFDVPAAATIEADRGTSVVAVAPPPVPDYDALADAEFADYHCSQWAGEAIAAGWPHELVPKVLRTMWRESRCDPTVRSTTSDSSLMQINDIVLRDWRFQRDWPNFDRATIFDPNVNLAVAYWLWTIDGWQPWSGGA